MPLQAIGTINVQVGTMGTANVQVGNQSNPTVRSLNYGVRTLKGSTDLRMTGAQQGDVIIYDANTDSFIVEAVSAAAVSLDAGTF